MAVPSSSPARHNFLGTISRKKGAAESGFEDFHFNVATAPPFSSLPSLVLFSQAPPPPYWQNS